MSQVSAVSLEIPRFRARRNFGLTVVASVEGGDLVLRTPHIESEEQPPENTRRAFEKGASSAHPHAPREKSRSSRGVVIDHSHGREESAG